MTAIEKWFVRHRPRGLARARFFCFPYAGGGAQVYRAWPASLGDDIEVCVAQLPGREKRFGEPALSNVDALAEPLGDAMSQLGDLPYVMFGHSLGALVAFEVARKLRRAGHPMPGALFASGHRAPQLPDPNPQVHALPEDEFVDELRELDGTPEAVFESPELLALVLPMLRADFAAAETYQYTPGEPLSCALTVLGGREDSLVEVDCLEPWREQADGAFDLQLFDGGHFFLHSHTSAVLGLITHALNRL